MVDSAPSFEVPPCSSACLHLPPNRPTSHGMDVLLLEAGKQIDTTAELKSLEWPYDHPRRGDMPYTSHALRGAEYEFRRPPYAARDTAWKTVHSYVQGW